MIAYPDAPLWLGIAVLLAAILLRRLFRSRVNAARLQVATRTAEALQSRSPARRRLAVAALRRLMGTRLATSAGAEIRLLVVEALKECIEHAVEPESEAGRQVGYDCFAAIGALRISNHQSPLVFEGVSFDFGVEAGPDLSGLAQGSNLSGIHFISCVFPQRMSACDFRRASFRNVAFDGTLFRNCDLRGAAFQYCEMRNVTFEHCLTAGLSIELGNAGSVDGLVASSDLSKTLAVTRRYLKDGELVTEKIPTQIESRHAAGLGGRIRGRFLRGPFWAFGRPIWTDAAIGAAVAIVAALLFLEPSHFQLNRDLVRAASKGELLSVIASDDLLRAANAAYEAGQFDTAVVSYHDYVELRPHSAGGGAFYNLGLAYLQTKQFTKAVEALDESERRGFPIARIASPRAYSRCQLGEFGAAQPDIKIVSDANADAAQLKTLCKTPQATP